MFFQNLFSHNDVSILGKPEGKEKQAGSLECSVSKATALVPPVRGLAKPGPRGFVEWRGCIEGWCRAGAGPEAPTASQSLRG